MLIGTFAALLAGACFAGAAVLQQRMASTRPRGEQLSWRLVFHLAHEPMWLAGIGVATASYVLQAVALSFAPLSVVQPVLTSEVVFAVPLSVRLHHVHLGAREWMAIVAVGAGLAGALTAAAPQPGNPIAPVADWAPVLGATVGLAAVAVAAGRLVTGRARAALFAVAAAVLMGLESSLMAATAHRFGGGAAAGFTAWETYAMVATSISVLLLIQSAFQAGPLAVSMPVTDALSPAAAITIGVTLFGERVSTSPLHLGGAVVGAVVLLCGIVVLDTSPVVHAVHEVEREQRPDGQPEVADDADADADRQRCPDTRNASARGSSLRR